MNLYQSDKLGYMKLIEKINGYNGFNYINTGLHGARESNIIYLVKYFIKYGAWEINHAYKYTTDIGIK
jgi:hypothetical protein